MAAFVLAAANCAPVQTVKNPPKAQYFSFFINLDAYSVRKLTVTKFPQM